MAATESAAASAASTEAKEQAEDAKAKTAAKFAELAERLAAAKAELQSKLDAMGPLREAAVAAETARVVAEEAARKAARDQGPVSVFISRKCRRKKWGPQTSPVPLNRHRLRRLGTQLPEGARIAPGRLLDAFAVGSTPCGGDC